MPAHDSRFWLMSPRMRIATVGGEMGRRTGTVVSPSSVEEAESSPLARWTCLVSLMQETPFNRLLQC